MAINGGRNIGADDFWQPEVIERLTDLWVNHLEISAAKIAVMLGCSKNAVISKAHRIDLPMRWAPAVKPAPKLSAFEALAPGGCSYPLGDPRDEDFTYCGHPADPGKSYCTEHRQVTSIPLKKATKGEVMAAKVNPAWL